MVIRVKLMLSHFIRVFFPNSSLRLQFTNAGIQLAQLRSLSNFVPFFMQILCSLDCSVPCGSPNCQRLKLIVGLSLIDDCLLFGFSVIQQSFRHFSSVILPLFGQRAIRLIGIGIHRNTSLPYSRSSAAAHSWYLRCHLPEQSMCVSS